MTDNITILSAEDSLVAIMIAISMSDENVKTSELITIQQVVNHLPIFSNYNPDRISHVATITFQLFEEEDGLDSFFELVKDSLPKKLYEYRRIGCFLYFCNQIIKSCFVHYKC